MARRAEADVVVVGAGLAGLTAARELQRAGASVLVVRPLPWPDPGGTMRAEAAGRSVWGR
jgi:glycine/D-amino acid oxidase-like deaminating enzyme